MLKKTQIAESGEMRRGTAEDDSSDSTMYYDDDFSSTTDDTADSSEGISQMPFICYLLFG